MCATLANVGLNVLTKRVVSVRVGGLSSSASARGTSEAFLNLCCETSFVLTRIGKVVNKFISTLYVTVMAEK